MLIQSANSEILEIVTFLFQNCLGSDGTLPKDQSKLVEFLEKAGFSKKTINIALEWLNGLLVYQDQMVSPQSNSAHMYTPKESACLGTECINYILMLEREKILIPLTREVVIGQLMLLTYYPLEVADVKWVTLVVLYSFKNQKEALVKFEQMIMGKEVTYN